jgi:hypothetical protein
MGGVKGAISMLIADSDAILWVIDWGCQSWGAIFHAAFKKSKTGTEASTVMFLAATVNAAGGATAANPKHLLNISANPDLQM